MLSGQLYHYQKKVTEFKNNLNPESVDKIEIAGVKIEASEFAGMDKHEIARVLKDRFSANFAEILLDEGLLFANGFWRALTSPLKSVEIEVEPSTDYQRSLISWLEKETPFEEIKSLLAGGVLTTDEQDYACYYGLSVLNELTLSQIDIEEISSGIEDEAKTFHADAELSQKPQILVLCSSYLAPLFVNLNSEFLPYSQSEEVNLRNIQEKIEDNKQISLVLLVGREDIDMLNFLQKKLPSEVMVSNLNLDESDSEDTEGTYFDKLVKETLGIKLT